MTSAEKHKTAEGASAAAAQARTETGSSPAAADPAGMNSSAEKESSTEMNSSAGMNSSTEKKSSAGMNSSAGAEGPVSPRTGAPRRFPTVGDILAMLGITLGAQIIVGVAGMLVLLVAGTGVSLENLAPRLLGRTQAIIYLISMSAALGGVLYYRHLRGGRGTWARFSLRGLDPALLLWAFLMIFAAGVALEPLLRLLPDIDLNVGRGAWTILMLVVMAPVFEELLCRGVVLGSIRARYGVTIAWIVSAVFFGVLHIQPVQVVNATVIGLILGFVYLSTESMWSVMILHALNNAVAYLMLMAGYENLLLIDAVGNRTLYAAIFIASVALLAVSGFMMARALRRMKASAEAGEAARGTGRNPGEKNPAKE